MPVYGNRKAAHVQAMKIAVIGAGRIGSTFAFHLARAGNEVTLVARGKRLEELRRTSKIVSVNGDEAPVRAEAALDPAVAFDLVLVTVLAHQLDGVMPVLKSSAAKKVLFMFNTFEKIDRLRDEVGAERFAFGFPTMTAFFVEGKLKSVVKGPGMATTLSSAACAEILKQAGLPTEVEPDMNSWLRSHVALVVPLLVAGQLTWQRSASLSWGEAAKVADAMVEGFAVVRSLGHALKPGLVAMVARLPGFVLAGLIWMLGRTAGVKDVGEFGPGETRALIDAMAAAAPGQTPKLLAIRP